MTSKEIVKLFREGLSIDMLSEREHKNQKKLRSERQAVYRKQMNFIKGEKVKNRKYKFDGKKIIVGPVCTKFAARSIIEQAIYDDLMKQSKVGESA